MKNLPSKELFNEVLKDYKFPFSYEYNRYNDCTKKIYFYINSDLKIDFFSISIYELAHKFKEWAFDNYYLSIIVFKINDNLYKCEIADIRDSLGEWSTKHSFKIDSETEAIYQATQWIADNKD